MNLRTIKPWSPRPEVFSDFYRQDRSYTNWRPHGSGDYLLIYTQSGAGRFVTETGTTVTRAGDAVLYAPKDMQDYGTCPHAGKWNLLWVHFTARPQWQTWLNWPPNPHKLKLLSLQEEARKEFHHAMKDIVALSRLSYPHASELAANALERALLWAHVLASNAPWLSLDSRVRQAIDFLVVNSRQPFQMKKLAEHCRVSESRLAHLFKQQTKTSPQQYLERHRIQQASILLRITNRSIAEIAAEVGYPDPFYFTNRFRLRTGKNPRSFRKEQ